MPPVGFEPTVSAGERPQTWALDRAATETGGRYAVCGHNDRAGGAYVYRCVLVG